MGRRAKEFDWKNPELSEEYRLNYVQVPVIEELVWFMIPFKGAFRLLQTGEVPAIVTKKRRLDEVEYNENCCCSFLI